MSLQWRNITNYGTVIKLRVRDGRNGLVPSLQWEMI